MSDDYWVPLSKDNKRQLSIDQAWLIYPFENRWVLIDRAQGVELLSYRTESEVKEFVSKLKAYTDSKTLQERRAALVGRLLCQFVMRDNDYMGEDPIQDAVLCDRHIEACEFIADRYLRRSRET